MHDLLFDMDGTLYDFKKSESVCLEKVFREADIAYTDEMIARYQSVNHRLWDEYEKGLVSQSYVENERMQLFFDEIGCRKDGHKAASDYVEYLSQTDFMIDGARDFLERIKDNRRIFIMELRRHSMAGSATALPWTFMTEFSSPVKSGCRNRRKLSLTMS